MYILTLLLLVILVLFCTQNSKNVFQTYYIIKFILVYKFKNNFCYLKKNCNLFFMFNVSLNKLFMYLCNKVKIKKLNLINFIHQSNFLKKKTKEIKFIN